MEERVAIDEITILLVYVIAGFIAGVADYSAGLGYGLVAAIIIVGLLDIDPRVVAGTTSLVQVLLAYPVIAQHSKRGNIVVDKRYVKIALMISASSSLGALVSMGYAVTAPRRIIEGLFSAVIIILIILSWTKKLINNRGIENDGENSFRVNVASSLVGFLAGIEKGISGGGFSIMLILVQRLAGIDLKSAIAGLPMVKLIPFTIIGIVYAWFGFFSLEILIALFAGGLLSSIIAPRILESINDRVLLAALTILAVYIVVKLAI